MINELARIAREIGSLLLQWRETEYAKGVWHGTQYKARADYLAHKVWLEKLGKLSPGRIIISEEDASTFINDRPTHYWIVDPIDGTASFGQGYAGFVTQAALIFHGRPVLAAIYAPVLDLLYLAEAGRGVALNGKKLSVPKIQQPEVLIDNYPDPQGISREVFQEFNLKQYIECGSISLKICKVAEGTAHLFVKDVYVRDWELAAPHLVMMEAGGFLGNVNGETFSYRGKYEHDGLVAAVSNEIGELVTSWYKSRHTKGE